MLAIPEIVAPVAGCGGVNRPFFASLPAGVRLHGPAGALS